MQRTDDKMLQLVQSDIFRHILHKIAIVEALKPLSKTLDITMLLPAGCSCFSSKQFDFSTDSIVFTFHKFGTAIVTDTVKNHWGHSM